MTVIPRVLFAISLFTLASCSSTKITDSWQAPTLHRSDMKNVLVVGVSGNPTNRVLFERGFVDALTSRGIRAAASFQAVGDAFPTRDAVTAYVRKNSVDYVIVTRLGGTEVTRERVPEQVRTYYVGPWYPTYADYWNTVTFTRDSYVDTKTTVVLTTSIYDTRTEELAWVGRSKTFEVGTVVREAGELAHQVVDNIKN
jgi:hypothetical protein